MIAVQNGPNFPFGLATREQCPSVELVYMGGWRIDQNEKTYTSRPTCSIVKVYELVSRPIYLYGKQKEKRERERGSPMEDREE